MKTSEELTKTYSGVFGNQVLLKSSKGQSRITIPPEKTTQTPSAKQIDHRISFAAAHVYARSAMQTPALRAAYAEKATKRLSPYKVAVNDYLTPPRVHQIDATGYDGNPGEMIFISATDNFRVVAVNVNIVDPTGTEIEKGVCAYSLPAARYVYTASVFIPDLTGVTIIAEATDTPGHKGVSMITL
ncbi:MAG: hypothetical protein WCK09_18155 [Bacteroidota bacterium]